MVSHQKKAHYHRPSTGNPRIFSLLSSQTSFADICSTSSSPGQQAGEPNAFASVAHLRPVAVQMEL